MPVRSRRSSDDRLQQLPDVFSVEDLQTQQHLSAKAASVYLARWFKAGRVARLGPRGGLWVNLDKTGQVGDVQRAEGIVRKHPAALVGGTGVLARAGWATPTNQRELLIPQGSSKAQFDTFLLVPVSPKLHAALTYYLSGQEPDAQWFLPTLDPAAAEAVRRLRGEDALDLAPEHEALVDQALVRLKSLIEVA